MNIFYVDRDPVAAARQLVDRHVVKQTLESAQLLSTAHRVADGKITVVKSKSGKNIRRYVLEDQREQLLYAATHYNGAPALWTRASVENYLWLAEHFIELCKEYQYRYGKTHASSSLVYCLQSPPQNVREWDATPVAIVMGQQYVTSTDPVVNYRNYYNYGKARLHSWTRRESPVWIEEK